MIPVISFVMPVYNNTKYLPSAVQSIFDQLTVNIPIELIIVDDGSTDETPEVADSLAKVDSRIKVVHQENQWIYASFNNGIKIAKGEYIYILNSDDMLYENAVNILLNSIYKYNHPDVIWTKVQWQKVDLTQKVIDEHDINIDIIEDEKYYSLDDIHRKMISVFSSGLALNQANLYKRELAINHPFRNDVYAGDALFNLSIADDIRSMAIISSPIYRYLCYNTLNLNASVGKYYGYEHSMFNEIMNIEISIFYKWGLIDDAIDSIVHRRLRNLSYEIEQLGFESCRLSFSDKIKRIYSDIADSVLRDAAQKTGREREYESRILNGTKNLLKQFDYNNNIPEFVRILTRYLPDNYLDDVNYLDLDYNLIDSAITDLENKDNIGKKYYYEKWKKTIINMR